MSYGMDFIATKLPDGKYVGAPAGSWAWMAIHLLKKGFANGRNIGVKRGETLVKKNAKRITKELLKKDKEYWELTEDQLKELSVDVVILVDKKGNCETMKDRKPLPGDYAHKIVEK